MTDNAFLPADILLPKAADMTKWSVIACDQFSSERDYWARVEKTVDAAPSTLRLIVPEAYLEETDTVKSAAVISQKMREYLQSDLFETFENTYIYLERTISDGRVRRGLVGRLDLELYDYTPGATAPVRASEKTIVSRLPARIHIRRQASIELPHIMALINDKNMGVIEPLADNTAQLELLYDFPMMEDGGTIKGWRVTGEEAITLERALTGLLQESDVQIIIGDGNHSLAAAKGYWDEIKGALDESLRKNHPARYALVELNNVYDPAIDFEAIHRVVFNTDPQALLAAMKKALPVCGDGYELYWHAGSETGSLCVQAKSIGEFIALLQTFLDDYTAEAGGTIDYIHGEQSLTDLSQNHGSIGFLIPKMDKSDFFKTVTAGGVFPKKSFSIGHARDKRYYLECRKITL